MNKFVKACVSKFKLLSIITAVIVAVGVVCMAVFGFAVNATNDDVNTLTIKVNQYVYSQHVDKVEDVAETFFSENNVKYKYDMNAEMYGDESELVYVFASDVELTDVIVNGLQAKFDALTATNSEDVLAGSAIRVVKNSEKALNKTPDSTVIRAAIATVVFAVAFLRVQTCQDRHL